MSIAESAPLIEPDVSDPAGLDCQSADPAPAVSVKFELNSFGSKYILVRRLQSLLGSAFAFHVDKTSIPDHTKGASGRTGFVVCRKNGVYFGPNAVLRNNSKRKECKNYEKGGFRSCHGNLI